MFERFEIEIFEFTLANFLFDLSDYQEALESFTRLVEQPTEIQFLWKDTLKFPFHFYYKNTDNTMCGYHPANWSRLSILSTVHNPRVSFSHFGA